MEAAPGRMVVMAGEALQRLTNGLVLAARHRVGLTGGQRTRDTWRGHAVMRHVAGDRERHSLAFFYDPNPETILAPLPVFRVGGKSLYSAKFAGHKGVRRS